MNVEEIRAYALSKPGVEESFPFGEQTLVFKVQGKIFLLLSLDSQPVQFNVKCDPGRAISLREQFSCIIPGYHMNKQHWNTVVIDGKLSNKQLKEQIANSYGLVVPKNKKNMRILLLLIFISLSGHAFAQATIPLKFKSEDDNKLIKETDTLKYYEATGDPEDVVSIDDDASYYKLLGKNHKVIDEGNFLAEGEKIEQDGKWIEHFDDGKIKLTGYYRRSKPVGTWKEFYPEGRIKTIYNFAIIIDATKTSSCMSGSYEEFYPDGKLKVNGFYAASRVQANDTITVDDPVTGDKTRAVSKVATYKPEKTGHWEYYTEDGELDKKEDH